MKILHILNELKFSGAEIMYVAAASDFRELGCELYVVNTAPSMGEYAPYFAKSGYKIIHWPYFNKSFSGKIKYLQRVIAFLKEEHIDVIHIHRSDMRWLMSFCAWRAQTKAIYTFHNVFSSRWYSRIYHILQRWSAKHILNCTFQTISDSVHLHEQCFYFNKTTKVYNWYDTNNFYPATDFEKNRIRSKLSIKDDALVIISVGGCSSVKQHSDIIKALPAIIEKYPNTIYLHLGDGGTLPEEIELSGNLGVTNYIRFEGNKSNVREYLIASDIYVMPSKYEGISITTIEALACKIPAILYDVPGLRDFNSKVECALLIEEDFSELSNAVLALYPDRDTQAALIKNGKDFVDENFSMKTNVQKIYNLYLGK